MNTRQSGAHRQLIEKEDRVRNKWNRENMHMLRTSRPKDFNSDTHTAYGRGNNERVYYKKPQEISNQQSFSMLSQSMGPSPAYVFYGANRKALKQPTATRAARSRPQSQQGQQRAARGPGAFSGAPSGPGANRGRSQPQSQPQSRAQSSYSMKRPSVEEPTAHDLISPPYPYEQTEDRWARGRDKYPLSKPGAPLEQQSAPPAQRQIQAQEAHIQAQDAQQKRALEAEYQTYMAQMEAVDALGLASVHGSNPATPAAQRLQQHEEMELRNQKYLEVVFPGSKRNQHGHNLLPHYQPIVDAGGLGAGPKHQDYYRYLSHYKPQLDAVALAPPDGKPQGKFYKSKGLPPPSASGMGYGAQHKHYNGYLSSMRVSDLPPETKVNMAMLHAI